MFLNSPHRETPKNVIKKKSRKSRFWIFGRIFCKNFSTRFFLQNVFCSVFELPSLRNTRKRDKTKKVEEKLTSKIFVKILEKVFDMDFLQKYFYGVFELPLPRNAQKRTKKKVKEKKRRMVGGWVWDHHGRVSTFLTLSRIYTPPDSARGAEHLPVPVYPPTDSFPLPCASAPTAF